jgi:sec-independent protein translocase protein TatA
MFGQMDLILIGGVLILLFGPKKIPDLMKGLGIGLKEFKKAQTDFDQEDRKPIVSYDKKEEPKSGNS